ncbi:MAG: hypothetical protein Fur0018_07280 [Anaerolineales bacterium]
MLYKALRVMVWLSMLLPLFATPAFAASRGGGVLAAGEGNDFATLALRDPWDMDAFTDISTGFDGNNFHITNFSTSNGVFSGKSTTGAASFYVLHPGYLPGMRTGKIGYLYPIDPAQYSCVSIASYVPADSSPRYQWVSWVEDMALNQGGYTYGMRLDTGRWKLYQYDLSTWPHVQGKAWTAQNWQGLRVVVTDQKNANFQVDWVRLTDCTPVYVTLSGLSAGQTYDVWIAHGSPARQILVAEGISPDGSGNYQLDVQGIEPDTYTYYVKQGSSVVQQNTLTIHPRPLPDFTHPSPFSGDEYSTLAGNAWDMSASDDIVAVYCAQWSISGGVLGVDTKPSSQQPSECVGAGAHEADPRVYLNTPVPEDISAYRYLSFRHYIGGSWQLPAEGMVVRWIWRTEHPTKPGEFCEYVSSEVVLDVNWQTYWADLYDAFNGTPVETGGSVNGVSTCPKNVPWQNQHNAVLYFRIDPNENITSGTFHQEFDWIALRKMDSVTRGSPFDIQMSLNVDPTSLVSMKIYYTTNPSSPTQHLAQGQFLVGAPQNPLHALFAFDAASPQGLFTLFLPLVMHNYKPPPYLPPVQNEVRYRWDTTGVAAGAYYICTVSNDGYNQSTYCSETPVVVNP